MDAPKSGKMIKSANDSPLRHKAKDSETNEELAGASDDKGISGQ